MGKGKSLGFLDTLYASEKGSFSLENTSKNLFILDFDIVSKGTNGF